MCSVSSLASTIRRWRGLVMALRGRLGFGSGGVEITYLRIGQAAILSLLQHNAKAPACGCD
jgi:hypothetical protein